MAFKRIRPVFAKLAGIFAFGAYQVSTQIAWAAGGITEKTAEDVASKLVKLLNDIIQPLGAFVIFTAVAWTAFQIVTTANRPEERARVMGGIPYILGGGVLLGGAMLVAGFVVGLMVKAGQ